MNRKKLSETKMAIGVGGVEVERGTSLDAKPVLSPVARGFDIVFFLKNDIVGPW